MKTKPERTFSIELKSKAQLKNVTLANGTQDSVLLEGSLGELAQAMFADDEILEVKGTKGVLRINLEDQEIKKKTEEVRREVKNE